MSCRIPQDKVQSPSFAVVGVRHDDIDRHTWRRFDQDEPRRRVLATDRRNSVNRGLSGGTDQHPAAIVYAVVKDASRPTSRSARSLEVFIRREDAACSER